MIETIKVSSKGQIVIPKEVRKNLEIKEGTKLILLEKGRKLTLEKETEFLKELEKNRMEKEKMGWLSIAEKSMAKVWDNPKDEEVWSKYL